MRLTVGYKSTGEEISVEVEGPLDVEEADALIRRVIEGGDEGPDFHFEEVKALLGRDASEFLNGRTVLEAVRELIATNRQMLAVKNQLRNEQDRIEKGSAHNKTLVEELQKAREDAMRSEQAAAHYQEMIETATAELLKSNEAMLEWKADLEASKEQLSDYEAMAQRRDFLENDVKQLGQLLRDRNGQVTALEEALKTAELDKARLLQRLSKSDTPKVSLVGHPDDDRVAVLPILPNGSLGRLLQAATVVADEWDRTRGDLVGPQRKEAMPYHEWDLLLVNLKEELDQIWVGKESAGWSKVTWIVNSALEQAPEEVRRWISSLDSAG
jgi:hypothetical protein